MNQIKENMKNLTADFNANLFMPMFLILTLVALINSSQYFFFLFEGKINLSNYILITLSKLIYFYYFILLLAILHFVNTNIQIIGTEVSLRILVHLFLLTASFVVHQTATFLIDKTLLGGNYSLTYENALFNNPLAWIDIVAYILLFAGILLADSKRLSRENEIKCAQLEILLVKSKLQELRTKIHPQFLFKTLGAIKMLIGKQKNREANNLLTMLSEFLRITVYRTGGEEIELEQELHFLRLYLEIERAAFGETISFKEKIKDTSRNALVPNSIIQPIVESLLYEMGNEADITFSLNLETDVLNSNLRIKMEIKFGIKNRYDWSLIKELSAVKVVRERLSQMYAENYVFEIAPLGDNSFEILISIPFKESYDESISELCDGELN